MTGETKEQKQRRTRLQLSCQPCRIGKLKCNRELPCEQCTKRSRETSCVYTAGAQESISFKSQAKAMRDKLENLERAVQHFKEADQQRVGETGHLEIPETSSSHDSASTAMTPGHLISSQEEGSAYIGPSHWQSIMTDIAEVKTYFDFEGNPDGGSLASPEGSHTASSPVPSTAPDLFLRVSPSISKETLIYSIPPRNVADRLLGAFFGSMDIYKSLIHLPTFQKQYQQFWQQPDSAPTAWLALLFCILALGFQYTVQSHTEKEPIYDSNTYLELAAHAIALADYTRPKASTLEGLILYIRCCQMQESERQFKDWLGLGLVTRLCLRMGYHRDPSHYPEISAFDGEMRRRVWAAVCFLDVTMSYQIGLISSITNVYSNVHIPRNLHDHDFGPSSADIPPSRPPEELTPISHSIYIARILPFFARAVHLSHCPVAPSLQEVYGVATRLQQVADEIPSPLFSLPPDQALAGSPEVVIKRFAMEILVQKARCILFRRYLGSSELKARKACVEAAMRSLAIQKALEDARVPGGPLNSCPAQQYWDLADAFLLSGIIIAMEISAMRRQSAEHNIAVYTKAEFEAMTHALQTSCSIWQASSIASEKSKRAAKALERVLQPRQSPRPMAEGQEFTEQDLLDAGMFAPTQFCPKGSRHQAYSAAYASLAGHVPGVEAQGQWLKDPASSLQAFDMSGLAPPGMAAYPPVSTSAPMQMDFSMQDPLSVDWISSRLPYFG